MARPVKDICPFTTMGLFNRGVTETNRKIIAAELAKLLGVDEAVPTSFEGIPVLNNCNPGTLPLRKIARQITLMRCGTYFLLASDSPAMMILKQELLLPWNVYKEKIRRVNYCH